MKCSSIAYNILPKRWCRASQSPVQSKGGQSEAERKATQLIKSTLKNRGLGMGQNKRPQRILWPRLESRPGAAKHFDAAGPPIIHTDTPGP